MSQGMDFVVKDDFMDAAYDTLQGAGFKQCQSEGCNGNKKLRYAPTPHTHSTSPNPNGWASIEDLTFCGDSQICQKWTAKA